MSLLNSSPEVHNIRHFIYIGPDFVNNRDCTDISFTLNLPKMYGSFEYCVFRIYVQDMHKLKQNKKHILYAFLGSQDASRIFSKFHNERPHQVILGSLMLSQTSPSETYIS
jgi:hypothetical protein